EWAYDRADVRDRIQHQRPVAAHTWRPEGADFDGHRYLARLSLPGRYNIDAVEVVNSASAPPLLVARLLVVDPLQARGPAVSRPDRAREPHADVDAAGHRHPPRGLALRRPRPEAGHRPRRHRRPRPRRGVLRGPSAHDGRAAELTLLEAACYGPFSFQGRAIR